MKKQFSFALFDAGETVFSALIFSTFFPLYITQHIETKVYSFLYGATFLLSFILALYFGKLADKKAKRKDFFILFSFLTSIFSFFLFFSSDFPFVSLFLFLLVAIFHQQAFMFYNSLLLNFEKKGFVSGLGVSAGYIASAVALLFFAKKLDIPEVYLFSSVLFFLFSIPSMVFLENPEIKKDIFIKDIFKDRDFIILILSILSLTEVANTTISMMGIYLKEVYHLGDLEIYRVIGISALGGVIGGVFWGYMSNFFGVRKLFILGFFLWLFFLLFIPFAPKKIILFVGLFAGFSLAHLWSLSRILILELFPAGEVSVRLSFLSLTERIASSTGLIVWSFFLFLTGDNYRVSVFLMSIFPISGFILFFKKNMTKRV